MSRDSATLLDLLKAARLAVEFMGSLDKAAFLTDLKTQSAVLHQLLILGEATKRLSTEFREQHQASKDSLEADCGYAGQAHPRVWRRGSG